MPPLLSRRRFLGLISSGCGIPLLGTCRQQEHAPDLGYIPGRFVNPNPIRGHVIRSHDPSYRLQSTPHARFDAVVVGAGISGLCAAKKLSQAGVDRVLLLEMESQVGGTSIANQEPGAVFPWGAHYIHVPPQEADCIHELLGEIGIIDGYDSRGWPRISAEHLLRWPHERLFMEGQWVDELSPLDLASEREREQFLRFKDAMLKFALYRGSDDRRGFAMPLLYSSSDTVARELDHISMLDYVRSEGWSGQPVDWLIDYACRDDYGGNASQISAWAGIHYFACRNYDYRMQTDYPTDVLTWPEGNGFIAKRLAAFLDNGQIETNAAVIHVSNQSDGVRVAYVDLDSGTHRLVHARAVVYAGKLHAAPYVVRDIGHDQRQSMSEPIYCPWLVAAVKVTRTPEGFGAHWENILHDSQSVGYLNPDHQKAKKTNKVLLYYLPLCEDALNMRRKLLAMDHQYWARLIVSDLQSAHPDLNELIEAVDIYRWGHGMIRPSPGLIWGENSKRRRQPAGSVFFATCDATGLPLFEEAVFNGYRAAEEALAHLGVGFRTSLDGYVDD